MLLRSFEHSVHNWCEILGEVIEPREDIPLQRRAIRERAREEVHLRVMMDGRMRRNDRQGQRPCPSQVRSTSLELTSDGGVDARAVS